MTEQFANTYQTTLNDSGGISSGDTSMIVTTATGSPAVNFRVKIENEYLLVTAKSGTTFTVTRGVEGSTAASHADGSTVTHVLTAGGLAQAISEGGTGAAGLVPVQLMFGTHLNISASDSTATYTRLMPVFLAGPMKLRAATFNVNSGNSGTVQWGLFDCSSNATACTKLAGGSGALSSSGFQSIAATSAPVDVPAGSYIFIWKQPSSNVPSLKYFGGETNIPVGKDHATFTWDDTPDITGGGWGSSYNIMQILLKGDIDGSGNQW